MTQLDIQLDDRPQRTRNGRVRVNGHSDYGLVQQPRPRGFIGQLTSLLLQPGVFFRTLPVFQNSRTWLLVAVILLAVTATMAVRQAEMNAAPADSGSVDMGVPPDMMGPSMGGGAISGDFGGLPPDMGMPVPGAVPGGATDTGTGVSTTWTTAVIATGGLLLVWAVQAVLLSEVSLFNGRAPRLGLNFQVAIYASVPLALMTGLQALYFSAGGDPGEPGLTGLITDWSGFAAQTPFVQALLLSLTSRLTIFWLWGLLLLYLGARHALHGRWWASLLVVFAWVAVLVVTPVVTGAVTAPTTEEVAPVEGMPDMPIDMGAGPSGMEGEGRPLLPPSDAEAGAGDVLQSETDARPPLDAEVEPVDVVPAS